MSAEAAPPVTVRHVRRDDYGQWRPLWDGYNAFYGRAGATALAEEITAATWERFFDAGEPVRALVAEEGDRLVGRVYWQTQADNTAGRALYDKLAQHRGFIVYAHELE